MLYPLSYEGRGTEGYRSGGRSGSRTFTLRNVCGPNRNDVAGDHDHCLTPMIGAQ
jgi:hypothetical protein